MSVSTTTFTKKTKIRNEVCEHGVPEVRGEAKKLTKKSAKGREHGEVGAQDVQKTRDDWFEQTFDMVAETSKRRFGGVCEQVVCEEDERPVRKKRKKGKRKKRKNTYSSAYEYRDEGKAKVSFSDFVSLVMTPTWRQQDCNDDIHPHCSEG